MRSKRTPSFKRIFGLFLIPLLGNKSGVPSSRTETIIPMEILDKCFFYDLNDILKFKKYNVFDLDLKQTFKNQETVFDTENCNFNVSFPNKSTLNHFTHITLENGLNLEYQDFILSKLHGVAKAHNGNKSDLSKEHNIQHLILIFDISSSWNAKINKNQHKTSENFIEIEGITAVLRIPLLKILDSLEHQDNPIFLKVLQFFRLFLSSPTTIADFFKHFLKLDITDFNLLAIIIDNLTFLSIYDEPQIIELTRKSKLNNLSKSLEKTQLEYAQLMEFMDYLNELHRTLGTLIVTTSFRI